MGPETKEAARAKLRGTTVKIGYAREADVPRHTDFGTGYHTPMPERAPDSRSEFLVRLYALGDEPGDDLSATTTAEERLAMVWPLTLQAWRLSGRALPAQTREQRPVRLVERGAADP